MRSSVAYSYEMRYDPASHLFLLEKCQRIINLWVVITGMPMPLAGAYITVRKERALKKD